MEHIHLPTLHLSLSFYGDGGLLAEFCALMVVVIGGGVAWGFVFKNERHEP